MIVRYLSLHELWENMMMNNYYVWVIFIRDLGRDNQTVFMTQIKTISLAFIWTKVLRYENRIFNKIRMKISAYVCD